MSRVTPSLLARRNGPVSRIAQKMERSDEEMALLVKKLGRFMRNKSGSLTAAQATRMMNLRLSATTAKNKATS